ncbi:MAG: TRAP transporter large permease [Sneathiella sp.]
MLTITPFIFLIFALFCGTAIAYLVGGSAVLGFIVTDNSTFLAALPQRVFSQLDVFAFLAMPLFILVGELMNRGGIADALIRFSLTILGRLKGGLGHVNILTSVFFAGISGSATADAAALGNTLVPIMEKQGYARNYAVAVTAASSIIGPIIPPSIVLIFYGALMNTSVIALFAAGIVPGLLLAAMLMGLNTFFAYRDNHPGGRDAEIPEFIPAFTRALPALSLPVIILSGILFGIMTPAEAAAVAAVVAALVGFLYRELKFSDIVAAAHRTVILTGAIFVILVAIATFGYLSSLEQIPQKLVSSITELGLGATGYLLVVNLVLLVAGMLMDVKAAVALLAPLLVPPALLLGVDPTHMGILVGFNLTVGLLTPPFGGVLLILSTVTNVNYWTIVRAVVPFLIAELIFLGFLIFVPDISLALPRALGYLN